MRFHFRDSHLSGERKFPSCPFTLQKVRNHACIVSIVVYVSWWSSQVFHYSHKLSFHLIYSFLKCHTGVRKPPFCQGDEDCTISTYSSLPLLFSLTWKIHVGSQKVTDKHFWDQMVGGHTEWLCLPLGCRLCTPDLWSGCASFYKQCYC